MSPIHEPIPIISIHNKIELPTPTNFRKQRLGLSSIEPQKVSESWRLELNNDKAGIHYNPDGNGTFKVYTEGFIPIAGAVFKVISNPSELDKTVKELVLKSKPKEEPKLTTINPQNQ